MILGLKRGEIILVTHQDGWAELFVKEKGLLTEVLGKEILGIEHIGSTAVPSLLSKPVIDVAILVQSLQDIESWPSLLHPVGYTYFGDREGRGDHFFAKGSDELRTFYLHVVASENQWSSYVRFRDTLRCKSHARYAYEQLKRQAFETHPNSRSQYTAAKSGLIQRILDGEYSDDSTYQQA